MPKSSDISSPSSLPRDGKPKAIKGIKGVSTNKKGSKDPVPRDMDDGQNAAGRRANIREHSVGDGSTSAANNVPGGGASMKMKKQGGGRKKGTNEADVVGE